MVFTLEEKVANIINSALNEGGWTDYFLIDVIVSGNKIEVFLDSDTAVHYEVCKKISRAIEAWLDENGPLGDKYVLEVSSAGIERPLKMQRQYKKNTGRDLKVNLSKGTALSGRLLKAEDEFIILLEEVKVKEGKKNIKKNIEHKIPYGEIDKAIVQIRF